MLPQFGFIVAQAGADSQQPPYYARPYIQPSNEYYENQFYQQPLPPIVQPTDWSYYQEWQQPQPFGAHKPIQEVESHWQEESDTLYESEKIRQKQEYNDLMLWMDNEFWEQRDDTYKERHQYLKDELKTVEQGTHSAFEDAMLDIEVRKEQTIECAENFKDYELSLINYQYEMEVNLLQEEYRTEKNGLQTLMLQTIAEKRKLIKEDKEDYEVNDVFDEAYKKIAKNKRILRKKSNLYERHASPSRLERRKQNRTQMLYNIHAAPSSVEQEELEADLLQMKGKNPNKLKSKF